MTEVGIVHAKKAATVYDATDAPYAGTGRALLRVRAQREHCCMPLSFEAESFVRLWALLQYRGIAPLFLE